MENVFDACKQNDTAVLKRLGVEDFISFTDQNGHTPLHIACIYNSIDVAKLLIGRGADVNTSNNNRTTALHSACAGGFYQMASLLIRKGANVNAMDKEGRLPLAVSPLSNDHLNLYILLSLSGMENFGEYQFEGMIAVYMDMAVNKDKEKLTSIVEIIVECLSNKKSIDLSNKELAFFTPSELICFDKLRTLNLSYNYFSKFPTQFILMPGLATLNLSHNYISIVPSNLLNVLPNLTALDLSYNNIDSIPSDFLDLDELDVSHNPFPGVPSNICNDKNKILFFLKYEGKKQPWNQIKLMLVGHEGVGKTTFLKSLQGHQAPANKGPDISTNGVEISHVEFSSTPGESYIMHKFKKKEKLDLSVWDFGGQAIFHNTHCFFLTSSAIYIVVFNMANESTHSRLQHWMMQISSVIDNSGNSMPILIVGTHADRLTQREQEQVLAKIAKAYPVSRKPTGIQGHFAVSLSVKNDPGLLSLKETIAEIAKNHPKLGVGQVMVPSFLVMIKEKLELIKEERKYLFWQEYKDLCQGVAIIDNFPVVEWTQILQELGVVIWHNTASLRDIVIINPQWLANALAGVVTMVNQESIARAGGVATCSKLYNVMKNKIPDTVLYPVILELLERFEIILRMRNYYSGVQELVETEMQDDDVKYFVPSLLLPFDSVAYENHPAIQFWKSISIDRKYTTLKRRFTWAFYPANFFPRLLLRFMHMQMLLLASWVDAVIIMNQEQEQYAFLNLFPKDDMFILEVVVLQHNGAQFTTGEGPTRQSLIAELAYAIARLDQDTATSGQVMKHNVIMPSSRVDEATGFNYESEIPFSDCIDMISRDDHVLRTSTQCMDLETITPDLLSCTQIDVKSFSDISELGKGGFGIVYKATMKDSRISPNPIVVAYKEILTDNTLSEDKHEASKKLHEFQHEMLIMSKVRHKNLVGLYGIIKAPLSLVLEYVPCGDFYKLLHADQAKFASLPLKWRLKLAIDIARGLSHLHKQTPPICHSDLRAPNIFIASFDPADLVVGKVADFGLSQQVFPFSSQVLHNVTETAPETWGDEGVVKSVMYDERSDVFSYAILLWCLFGVTPTYSADKLPEYDFNPYGHLKDSKGRPLHNFSLRVKIREGARPIISSVCPQEIRKLMESCWESSPNSRPYFPFILESLYSIYTEMIGVDDYLNEQKATKEVNEIIKKVPKMMPSGSKTDLVIENWNPRPNIGVMATSVVSLLFVGGEIWAGTSVGTILVLNAKSGKLEQAITIGKSGRVTLLQVSKLFLWVSCESEMICMINIQTKSKILEIDNEHPVVCMAITYHHAGPTTPVVWVADTKGCISLWDLMTIHKFLRFQLIKGTNPPVVRHMDILNEYIWMAVGSDIVAIETQTLQRIVKPSGSRQINCIAAVANTQEVWTCGKDGKIKVWKLKQEGNRKSDTKINIVELQTVTHKTEVKFLRPLYSLPRGHVVTGDFNGNLVVWNSKNMNEPEEFPMPAESKDHCLQCAVDIGELGLWLGTMNLSCPLLRYNWVKRIPKIGQSRMMLTKTL